MIIGGGGQFVAGIKSSQSLVTLSIVDASCQLYPRDALNTLMI